MNLYKVKYWDGLNPKIQQKECLADNENDIIEYLSQEVSFNKDIEIELIEKDVELPYFID